MYIFLSYEIKILLKSLIIEHLYYKPSATYRHIVVEIFQVHSICLERL